jgi:transcriptional regulator with XRE-family HTH domain
MVVMSDHHTPNARFKTLGTQLKYLREQSKESLAEVSGAVEIDESSMQRIEDGFERPAEDILLLLISHFGMPEQEAVRLWELAGYDGAPETLRSGQDDDAIHSAQKAVVMFLALDTRTIYTDGLEVTYNQAGVTFHFTQTSGKDQPTLVSRVGMSYEQAEQVMQTLQQTLLKAKYLKGPKPLPPSLPSQDTEKKKNK